MANTGSTAPLTGDCALTRATVGLDLPENSNAQGLADLNNKLHDVQIKDSEVRREGGKRKDKVAESSKGKKAGSDESEFAGDDERSSGGEVDSKSDSPGPEDQSETDAELDAQIARLEAEQAAQPEKYKTTFELMTRLCEENNRLRKEMDLEPELFDDIIKGTPLESLYVLYGKQQSDRSAKKAAKKSVSKQSSESEPS